MIKKRNEKEEQLISKMNKAISELVYEKTTLIKAYNYYHAKRDPEQFRHLEENYGIGTPTSVEFVPLVKKHIDALVGEFLSIPVNPKISCKDKETLSSINREKQLGVNKIVYDELKNHLNSAVYSAIKGEQGKTDAEVQSRINTLLEDLDRNFISSYEMAAQNIVNWSIQSRNIDFQNKRKAALIHLLVSGTLYYQVCKSLSGTAPDLKVLNPLNTFIDRNPESPYLNKSTRGVIREYLSKQQILTRFGKYLTKEDLESIEGRESTMEFEYGSNYIRTYDTAQTPTPSDGILGGMEITPMIPYERTGLRDYRLYPVYTVEYLESEKEDGEWITNRYKGVRIGSTVYIHIGKDEDVIRSVDNPRDCTLSINGMFYTDINGDPFSLILSTANLQDRWDIINFFKDNVIAESGSVGDWVDVAHLPKFLGDDIPERLMKWKAYKKSGIALYDSSQEGDMINTAFNGYDDTIKAQTIQALDLALMRIEETVSTITGVFREKLGGIEQRDAVSNVQVGIRQSTYVTKQYYQVMDLMTRDMLLDILNLSKIVYKNGISGTLVLGENLTKIFTALPEHYTVTDFDIHVVDSNEYKQEEDTIRQLTMELTKGGAVDPEIVIEMITSKGLTKMKSNVLSALNKKKQESNQLGQLSQQVQQLDQQLKQTTSEAQKLQNEVQKLNAEKLQLERDKLNFQKELDWYIARSDNRYKENSLEWEKKRVELEGLQLLDNNTRNDEIKNK